MRIRWAFCLLPVLCFGQINELEPTLTIAEHYTRPITFLGICDPKDAILLANKLNGIFVVICPGDQQEIPKNMIHLKTICCSQTLNHLSDCEHFDIVLVNKHFCPLNPEYAQALYHLGENVIVSLQPDQYFFSKQLINQGFKEIQQSENKQFIAQHSISYLRRTQWLEQASDSNAVREIYSDFNEKSLIKHFVAHPKKTPWLPGINLITFKILHGTHPKKTQLENEIKRIYHIPHPDWMPNNIIVQGETLELIDWEELPEGEEKTTHDETMLSLMIQFVKAETPGKTVELFYEIMHYCFLIIHGDK